MAFIIRKNRVEIINQPEIIRAKLKDCVAHYIYRDHHAKPVGLVSALTTVFGDSISCCLSQSAAAR